MKILVLGSEGFIGSHLVSYFLERGYDVHGCDLGESASRHYTYVKVSPSYPEWDLFFSAGQFDCCINAAGSGNVGYSVTHPVVDFEANTLETVRVLDAIRRSNPACRYLFISSAAVYGNPQELPIKEEAAKSPLSPYGWHKLLSEQLCKEYNDIYRIKTAIVRPFSVYGPGLRKQLFWDVFNKFKEGGDVLELFGTGKESRDFIFIEDLVRAIDAVVSNGAASGEVYNLASGVETSIHEAMDIFLESLQWPAKLVFNQVVRKGDPLNWRADTGKLSSLGFRPETGLKEGLRRHAAWLKSLTRFPGA